MSDLCFLPARRLSCVCLLLSVRLQLESSEHKPWYDLLKVFAYGTYMDYKSTPGLPEIAAAEITKLKQLTIVDMASTQRVRRTHTHMRR